MVFLPTVPAAILPGSSFPPLNMGHGFLDDNVMFGLGIGDQSMSTIVVPASELLSGGKMCADILVA
jgi:hypothetical protein